MSHRFFLLLIRCRWPVAMLLLIATVALLPYTTNLKPNNALRVWFLQDDPALKAHDRFRALFGNDEVVVIGYSAPEGIYTLDNVKKIQQLTDELKAMPSLRRVVSLTGGIQISGNMTEIVVEPLLSRAPKNMQDVEALRQRVRNNPIFADHIVSGDEQSTLLLCYPQDTKNMDVKRPEILAEVDKRAKATLGTDGRPYEMAGMGVVFHTLNELSYQDTQVFSIATILIIVPFLLMILRTRSRVATSMALISCAVTGVVGVYVLSGNQLNMISSILIPLSLNYCLMDSVYLLEGYEHILRNAEPGRDRAELVAEAMTKLMRPCLFTSLTTAAGFASLMTAQMAILRNFGLYAAIGILIAWALAMVICPLGMYWGSTTPVGVRGRYNARVDRLLGWIERTTIGRPGWVIAACLLMASLAMAGLERLESDTYSIQLLKQSNRCRADSDRIERTFGNYLSLEFTITTPAKDGLKDPYRLRRIDELQRRLEAEPEISKTLALPQVVKRLHEVFRGEEKYHTIPDTSDQVSQLLFLFESGPENDIRDFADYDYRIARLTCRIPMTSARGMKKIIEKVQQHARKILNPGVKDLKLTPAGYLPLYVRMMAYVTQSQIGAFATAFLVIFSLILLLFRSFSLTLAAILPNLFPLAITLGVMGWIGIRLDIATVMIAPISIGMSVDDTIHFFYAYREQMRACKGDTDAAVAATLRQKGPALLNTGVILFLGYVVLVMANVKSVIYFGLLTGLTMLGGVVAEAFLTPAVLALFKPRVR